MILWYPFIPLYYIIMKRNVQNTAIKVLSRLRKLNSSGCLAICKGRLGDSGPLERHEFLWVVGCKSFEALREMGASCRLRNLWNFAWWFQDFSICFTLLWHIFFMFKFLQRLTVKTLKTYIHFNIGHQWDDQSTWKFGMMLQNWLRLVFVRVETTNHKMFVTKQSLAHRWKWLNIFFWPNSGRADSNSHKISGSNLLPGFLRSRLLEVDNGHFTVYEQDTGAVKPANIWTSSHLNGCWTVGALQHKVLSPCHEGSYKRLLTNL